MGEGEGQNVENGEEDVEKNNNEDSSSNSNNYIRVHHPFCRRLQTTAMQCWLRSLTTHGRIKELTSYTSDTSLRSLSLKKNSTTRITFKRIRPSCLARTRVRVPCNFLTRAYLLLRFNYSYKECWQFTNGVSAVSKLRERLA